jgi:pyruvate formate lyase activating enzyme
LYRHRVEDLACRDIAYRESKKSRCGNKGIRFIPVDRERTHDIVKGADFSDYGVVRSVRAGCNLTCRFCQNWDISKAREFDRLTDEASPEAIAEAARSSGCRSVAFTYNDPVVFIEYAIDVAQACRAKGVKTIAVSAGYMCDAPRAEFYRHIDAANIDLKGFTEVRRPCPFLSLHPTDPAR